MRIAHACRDEMVELRAGHGGAGNTAFKSMFEHGDFQTPWWFVHAAYLMPGGGIGHHRHDNCEEIFVTLDNAAQFTHNGRTAEIMGGPPYRCAVVNRTPSTITPIGRRGSSTSM